MRVGLTGRETIMYDYAAATLRYHVVQLGGQDVGITSNHVMPTVPNTWVEDPGVAVYFTLPDVGRCVLACDQGRQPRDNVFRLIDVAKPLRQARDFSQWMFDRMANALRVPL